MTETELILVMDKVAGLWPNMRMTVALTEEWRVMLRPCQYEAAQAAIKEHWQEEGNKIAPDQRKVRELCRVHTRELMTPEQHRTAERFYAMTPIEQARAQRDWFKMKAEKEADYGQRVHYEKIAQTAADKAARLYRIQQRTPPPRIATVAQLERMMRCKIRRENTATVEPGNKG